jgi:hypothetical protein
MSFLQPGTIPSKESDLTRGAFEDWLEEVRTAIRNLQMIVSWLVENTTWSQTLDLTINGLAVAATSPESMRVTTGIGAGFIDSTPVFLGAASTSADLVAPTVFGRIDSVVYDGSEQAIVIVEGDEAVPPVAPSLSTDQLLLAYIHHTVGETAIYDVETSGEGWIEDARTLPA